MLLKAHASYTVYHLRNTLQNTLILARLLSLLFLTALNMDEERAKVLEDIVSRVKQQPSGIRIKKLALFYKPAPSLGFKSMTDIVKSLNRDLVVEGKMVFHRDNQDKHQLETAVENLVAVMREHPEGISMKTITRIYSQVYHHNLPVAALGFKNIGDLIRSLKEDLVVRGKMVFHTIHLPQDQAEAGTSTEAVGDSRPAAPNITEPDRSSPAVTAPQLEGSRHFVPPTPISFLGPPLLYTASSPCNQGLSVNPQFAAPKPPEPQTQQQLYQRVVEVSHLFR